MVVKHGILIAPLMQMPCELDWLPGALDAVFHCPVRIRPEYFDLSFAFDGQRDQFHSTRLLVELCDRFPEEVDRLVGLVDVDLYVPVLTFVFGEAQLGGNRAIVSTLRLREPWLPAGAPEELLRRRLLKTLIHELGHNEGLRHCLDSSCVMTSANNLEMLDLKDAAFCTPCQILLSGQ